jgi:predicted phosphodiesterase
MNRLIAFGLAIVVISGAAWLSVAKSEKAPETSGVPGVPQFEIKADPKVNPWTHLNANADPAQFQFAVVSDRTGGHRRGVFSKAVQQVNLMQPEFVMSVGDLIEGQTTAETNRKMWDEFDSYAKQFKMPFFYCPGNHDAASLVKTDVWTERLGRRYYHFGYKGALFIVMNTQDYEQDDPKAPPKQGGLRIGKRQREYLAETLKANPNSTWTFIFLHHPIWAGKDNTTNGWLDVEEILKGRKYTVFCGHVHRYQKYIRNGMNYYQLATTGGGSSLRGIEYGEFDQIAWMTMKKDGPVMANVLLSGIVKDDLRPFESPEEGAEISRDVLPEVVGVVTLDGKPAGGLSVKFTQIVGGGEIPLTGQAKTAPDGTFTIYGTRKGPGLKAGRYAVTFETAAPLVNDPKAPMIENRVPEKYRALNTTPFRETVKDDSPNRYTFKLEKQVE